MRSTRRLFLEVPGALARLPPAALEAHVLAHWDEWQNSWQDSGSDTGADELWKIDAGQPIFLVARGAKHYLVAEGTRVTLNTAA